MRVKRLAGGLAEGLSVKSDVWTRLTISSARRIFGVSIQRRSPGPLGGSSSTSIAADRALLELERMTRADETRGELADARFVTDERNARACGRASPDRR